MTSHRTLFDATLLGGPTTVGASQSTPVAVSKTFGIPTGALSILIAVKTTNIVKTTGITLQLQTAALNDDSTTPVPMWTTATGISATPSTAGTVTVTEIRGGWWVTAQVSAFPLGLIGRLVCTTGASDTITIEQVVVIQSNH